MDTKFGLPFFAQHLQADVRDLNYVIMKRKYNDKEIPAYFSPAIEINGIENYVYSLYEGQFVRLGEYNDSVIAKLSTSTILEKEGIKLVANKSGVNIRYKEDDFRKVFSLRTLPLLLEKL
ncbi:MAG: hypothetical protein E7017_03405 [Alphaproteobacteria bacterium]|nr:hypothetical protein [Alphaproteobacteria bacterium]